MMHHLPFYEASFNNLMLVIKMAYTLQLVLSEKFVGVPKFR